MADNGPPAWEVTQQTETVDLGPQGAYVPGVRVAFRTRSGAIGSVFLPTEAYTVERVRAAINERAAVIESIARLAG